MNEINNNDKLIFVNIKNSYEAMINNDKSTPFYRENIKEYTRKYRTIADSKADKATHILGCYKGIVKEVIKISHVLISDDNYPGRKVFEGEELKNSQYLGMNIRNIFDNLANFRVKYYNL